MTLDRRLTAAEIIEQARIRDARFLDLRVPDGALVTFMNTKQRTLILQLADAIQPLIDETETIATVLTPGQGLVGFDDANNPYYITTIGTGYPVSFVGGVPYVDTTGVPISFDPYGEDGGNPGFPLPVDILRLVGVTATYEDGTSSDIDVIPERSQNKNQNRNPAVFVSGARLIPIRTGTSPYRDHWSSITGLSISWIGMTTVTTLLHRIDLPTVLHECIISGIAAILAANCPAMSKTEREGFQALSREADNILLMAGRDLLNQLTQHSVLYNDG